MRCPSTLTGVPEATRNGVRVHYEVVGSGLPLIMVAGAALDGSFWRRAGYAERLADEFLCVLFDPRGMGKSSRPADSSGYSIRETAADILAITDHLELSRFAFWGSSLGGWVGIVLAADQPQRVAALVLNGATPSFDYPGVGRGMREMAERVRHIGDTAIVVGEICDAEGLSPNHWMRTIDHGDSDVVAALAEGWLDYDWPARAAPHRLDVPTLILMGEHEDPRGEARAIAQAMPNARAVTLPGVAHIGGHLAVEDSLAHAVPFLRRWTSSADVAGR
jgi:pimeloyl-ACP methyl ester carboxylesterase